MGGGADWPEIVERLGHADASVRRIAVRDLIRRGEAEPRIAAALLAHLPRERDERAALLIIGRMGAAGHEPAMPVLKALYDDRRTPARVAHAAILAHDSIERAVRRGRTG